MNWTELLTAELEAAYMAAGNLMNKVEDDTLGWKPETGTNWMTTGQLLMHITESCGMCFKGFVTGDWGMPAEATDMKPEEMLPPAEKMRSVSSVAEAKELLAKDKELALAMLAQAGEENLANKLTPAPWNPKAVPLGRQLLGMIQHQESHKGQLFYYLKLQGKPVNTMHLYGMA